MQANTTPSTLTIGIDLGDRQSHLCVLDADGEVVEEGRIATTPQALRARFEGLASTRIALEVGGHSAWVSELLAEVGHEVIVANARKLRMIFQSDSRNERLDAEQLARVARMDSKLLYPIEDRNRSAGADLAVMRSRDVLVATRTRLVNHVDGVLESFATSRCEMPVDEPRHGRTSLLPSPSEPTRTRALPERRSKRSLTSRSIRVEPPSPGDCGESHGPGIRYPRSAARGRRIDSSTRTGRTSSSTEPRERAHSECAWKHGERREPDRLATITET